MEYTRGLFNVDGMIESFGDGLIYHKTRLALNIADYNRADFGTGDIQMNRHSTVNVRSDRVSALAKLSESNGEKFKFRRLTNCLSQSTVYGVVNTLRSTTPQHSYLGMSKKYLTNEGLPNEQIIIKRLRELGMHHDVKEARFGQFYNMLFTKDYYDNMTALFAKLHLFSTRLSIQERMGVHDHDVVISTASLTKMVGLANDDERLAYFKSLLSSGTGRLGFYEQDYNLETMLQNSIAWFNVNKNDPAAREYRQTVKVWHMYKYDDGHNVSGRSFGSEFGFDGGKFLIPECHNTINYIDGVKLVKSRDNWFSDENIDKFGSRYAGYLNLSGMTELEIAIVNHILLNTDRMTPFLCDQELALCSDSDKFLALASGEISTKQTVVSSKQVRTVMSKLAMNHRAQEDMLCAVRSCKYLLAQPANETAESHWWNVLPKIVDFPKMGLKRAALHFMLEDEGVCISVDSIKYAREYLSKCDRAILESVFVNSCWFWAEYLTIYNKTNSYDLAAGLLRGNDSWLVERERPDIMVSALIGRPVPIAVHSCCTTQWAKPLSELARLKVCFGTISLTGRDDYNYTLSDKDVIFNSVVPPSGLALVTGLGGSLIQGTPYGSMFGINQAVKVRKGMRTITSLNYNDLWALGVVSRFNGYDLKYKCPSSENVHTIYAANNVSIANPPVLFDPEASNLSYAIRSITERDIVFGSDTTTLLSSKSVFYWNRFESTTLESPKWSAGIISNDVEEAVLIRGFECYLDETKKYTVAISAEYDVEVSDFHVAKLTAGIGLPTLDGGLLLDAENPAEQTTELDMPVLEDSALGAGS
ncbi:capsid protein [Red clover powdery mildew-associated totivirus 5]|uniref:Capsid protein n=1 Tax=Red clover powdery mildew-associated totivirus 5 TaxID=1714366 RepID=A0A0S3Q297_9VIRU|nr:capsid protein [Red clover powdery mildew-associated totivirus 5]BAT62485.1 capsid protein [Red clover powdery mildew-associated totivirus 5]